MLRWLAIVFEGRAVAARSTCSSAVEVARGVILRVGPNGRLLHAGTALRATRLLGLRTRANATRPGRLPSSPHIRDLTLL